MSNPSTFSASKPAAFELSGDYVSTFNWVAILSIWTLLIGPVFADTEFDFRRSTNTHQLPINHSKTMNCLSESKQAK